MTASALQFIEGQPLRPVVVLAGRNPRLVQHCLAIAINRLAPEATKFYDAVDTPVKTLLTEVGISNPFFNSVAVIYQDLQKARDLDLLSWFADYPTSGITLLITANSIRRDDGERWIPSRPHVLYIDCANLSEDHIRQLAMLSGLTTSDAEWLVDYHSGDLDAIIETLELCEVFEVLPLGFVKHIVGSPISRGCAFLGYDVPNTPDSALLLRRLRHRLLQLVQLSAGIQARAPVMELAKRADMEPFQVKRLYNLAKITSPSKLLEHLAALILADEAASQHAPGVEAFCEVILHG